ncbi:MAG: dUTP diphosphatase [Lachnospiraceae bacterium]|nr:dUTP diphosphatase [Lachnospiraceae bacterium]
MRVKIKKLDSSAVIPTRGSEESAGMDLYSCASDRIMIMPHETVTIHTGIAIEIPKGIFGGIFARSELSCKKGLAPANKVGMVDSDYRGEVIVALHNDSDVPQTIEPMERVAQLILLPYIPIELEEVEELSDTKH